MLQVLVPEKPRPTDVVAVGVLTAGVRLADSAARGVPLSTLAAAREFVTAESFDAAAGNIFVLAVPGEVPSTVLVSGLGSGSPSDLRLAAVAIGRHLKHLPDGRTAAVALDAPSREASAALVEGLTLGAHEFSLASTSVDDRLVEVDLIGEVNVEGLQAGEEAAAASTWAQDLGNLPANLLYPESFGQLAIDQLTAAGCDVVVRDESWLKEQGFGGVLAVGGGALHGPRLIEASWAPARVSRSTPHVVLVGKGITFDTGGLNLKPVEAMRMMHTDMCGGAAVLGALQYAAMMKLPLRVTALVPTAENAVSGSSMRPSDVITHFGGRTTEIGNTDAEGRLVLADALAYAVARLKPSVIVDIATLTGAMKVALGLNVAGYFANDDALAGQLEAAAASSGEAVWRMPLEHAYIGSLDSPVADMANDPGNPGGITAALFLQRFVADVPWAHFDIAGPARASEQGPLVPKGATGFGARLLSAYLSSLV